jgi:hypothetical protein
MRLNEAALGLSLACIVALDAGCRTKHAKSDLSVMDAMGGTGGVPTNATGGVGPADAQSLPPGGRDGSTSSDLANQNPPADGPAAQGDRPKTIASVQNVSFTITNGSDQDRFVVTKGHLCQPYAVARLAAGSPQPLRLDGSSVVLPSDATRVTCEGTGPGTDYFSALHRIRPGQSFNITWDARAFVEKQVTLPCLQDANASHAAIVGALQPVGPGSYRVTIGLQTLVPNGGTDLRLPRSCTPVSGSPDDFTCTSLMGGLPMAFDQLCYSNAPVTADFLIPEHGDVNVALPAK